MPSPDSIWDLYWEVRLRAIEDRHILRVLTRQQDLGLDVFTDGELRRRNFMSDFIDAVAGFDTGDAVARSWKGSVGVAVSSFDDLAGLQAYIEHPAHQAVTPGDIHLKTGQHLPVPEALAKALESRTKNPG